MSSGRPSPVVIVTRESVARQRGREKEERGKRGGEKERGTERDREIGREKREGGREIGERKRHPEKAREIQAGRQRSRVSSETSPILKCSLSPSWAYFAINKQTMFKYSSSRKLHNPSAVTIRVVIMDKNY